MYNYNLFFIPDKRVIIDIDIFINNFYYALKVQTILYIETGEISPKRFPVRTLSYLQSVNRKIIIPP